MSHSLTWTWIALLALAMCLALPSAGFAAATPSPAEPACERLQSDDTPTVKNVTRDVGPRRGGAMVTINGSGLQGATVRIGGKKAFVVSNSANKLVIVTPPGRRGRRDLVIRTPQGQRTTSSYTYL